MDLKPDRLQSILEDQGSDDINIFDEDKIIPSLIIAPQSYNMIYSQDPKTKQTSSQAMKWTLQPFYAKESVSFPSLDTRSMSFDLVKYSWKWLTQRMDIVFMQSY